MANNNEFQFWDHLTDEEIMGSLESGTFEIPTDILARSLEEQNNFEPTIPPEEQMVQEEEPPQPTSAFEVEKQRDTLPVPEPLGREKPGPEPQAPQQTEEPSLRLGALDQFKGSEPQFVSEMPETQIAPDLEREVADMIQRNLKDETADKQDLTAPTPAAGIAKPAAEFIGGIEAPKGYNQIQGRNKFAPLNEMTLNEVKKFQKAMTSKLGHESSAVGRYQIIGTTLEELMRRMKLTGKEKFTPQLQDRMFNVLLKKRGLNDYLAGEIDEFEFANNLAKEWASLPVVKDMGKRKAGFSYYAGVGSNKSLVDPEDVLGMVRDLREEYQIAQGPQSGGGGGGATEEELFTPTDGDVGAIESEVVTEPRQAWENVFNFSESLGLSRSASQKLANLAEFVVGFSPSASADVLRSGAEKIGKGRTTEGLTDIAFETVPLVGDVGQAIFAGIRSTRGQDSKLFQALQEKMRGRKSAEEVRKDTGWFESKDGSWQYEVDDSEAKYVGRTAPGLFAFNEHKTYLDLPRMGDPDRLGDVIQHDKLYEAYPDLKEVKVRAVPGINPNLKGAYDASTDTLYLNNTMSPEDARSVAMHEIQHAIQAREGWIPGGNSGMFLPEGFKEAVDKNKAEYKELFDKKYPGVNDSAVLLAYKKMSEGNFKHLPQSFKDDMALLAEGGDLDKAVEILLEKDFLSDINTSAFQSYEKLIGEAQARNVQTRLDFTEAERKEIPPQETFDYTEEEQIKRPRKQPTFKDFR